MSIASPAAASAPHPLLAQLVSRHGFAELTSPTFATWIAQPGDALLVFAEDPVRVRETLDLAVIAPEILRMFPDRFRPALLLPPAARAIAVRYGLRRWPALVVLRDGGYVGAIEGLRDWDSYRNEIAALLAAPVTRPPSIGVAVAAPDAGSSCH